MDTLVSNQNLRFSGRTFEYLFTASLFLFLVVSNMNFQPAISANDVIAANYSAPITLQKMTEGLRSDLTHEQLMENFEQRIAVKYSEFKVNSISDGIKHIRMVKYFNGRPVKINVVEVNRQVARDFEVRPALASKKLMSKKSLRGIANDTNSIVAINGGFFKPQTGVPLGTLVIDKKLYTGPIYDRVAMGIFENGYDVGRVQLDAKIKGNGHTIKIDNINQPRMLSSYILGYTRDWGNYAPASPQYGVQLQIVGNKITAVSANPLFIPENGMVLVGPKSILGKLFGSSEVELDIKTNPKWENVEHVISGGPYLVKNSDIFVDTKAQRLQSIDGRNPRTAIGYTKDNDLILLTADGREGSSVGLTLYELAVLMKSLNCENAINLDGGGSTVMYVNGQIVNRPATTEGIALSNALVIAKRR